ncbi:MAG: DUF1836 domain-containing protein [Bacillota bacterium]|nr:DUF1836 domain-containing protein [Bacillota bacterium]
MDNILIEILADSVDNTSFRTGDIPDIDLYMDQITGFINKNFAPPGGEKERFLTKTMVHNYSKEGLIKPVKGKKYTKEHIIQMILVYQLKNTLKISDIKTALTKVYAWDEYDECFLAQCFDRHMESKEGMVADSVKCLDEILNNENLDLANKKDLFVMLLNAAAISAYFKNITESLAGRLCGEDNDSEA